MTPQEKKKNELLRDHRVKAEYPKMFRKGWPRKKKGIKRNERRATKALIGSHRDPELIRSDIKLVAPNRRLTKRGGTCDGVWKLKDYIEDRREGRAAREGRKHELRERNDRIRAEQIARGERLP
jgi:hypothetical protein